MASVEIFHVAYTLVHALTTFSPKLAVALLLMV
jgi:hypothetical protein